MSKVIVTGEKGNLSLAVAKTLKEHGLEVENLGLRDGAWKEKSFSGCQSIVHIAGIVPKTDVKPQDFYRVNSELTKELATRAKADGVKQFVYISSMAVYGAAPTLNRKKGIIRPDTPCLPTSDYGKSKLLAEQNLERLKDEEFHIAVIRVPSIYGKGKTEYFETYRCFVGNLNKIPEAFTNYYKSILNVDNLCQLIYLIVQNESEGLFCPDDGKISAFDLCRALMPQKETSRVLGALIRMLRWDHRVKEYYGSICYNEDLTNVFEGTYRVSNYQSVIREMNDER